MEWFLAHNPDVGEHVDMSQLNAEGKPRLLLTIANRKKLERIYKYVLDEKEFLAPNGIRPLSKFHKDSPFILNVDGHPQRSITSRPNPPAIFLAEIPIGAGRSGFR